MSHQHNPPKSPIPNTHLHEPHNHHQFHQFHSHRPKTLPDFIFTALSLLFLFSSSPPSKPLKIPSFSCPFNLNPRRLIKISTTMSNPNPNSNPRTRRFATPQSLSDWLKPRLPSDSFASWGVKPGTKNIHNLWLELSEGETELADAVPPVRTVNVVTVRVLGNDNRILVESQQELSDGSVRDRFRPLSEKMKPNESPESAVIRAVREELGSIIKGYNSIGDLGDNGGIVRIVPDSYRMKVEERNSASYPGLPACYVLHSYDAWVEGLPEDDFCTEEDEEYTNCDDESGVKDKAISVKKHYWKWVSSDSV